MKELKNDRDVLQALLDGETIEQRTYDNEDIVCNWWMVGNSITRSNDAHNPVPVYHAHVRIKPKTININGYEVPEPLREEPEEGTICYYAFVGAEPYKFNYRPHNESNVIWLKRGMLHDSLQAAELHKKALLSFTDLALKKRRYK
jgi:hypothetical protein